VYNDNGNLHTESEGGALSVEIKAMAYSDKSTCLGNTTFYQYQILNKGADLDSIFIGIWSDPDLGCYTDDYIGCDTLRNMGIVYGGTENDGGSDCPVNYGNQPPYLGIRIIDLQGVDPMPQKLMSGFMNFSNDFSTGGNPQEAEDYYGYLQSVWADGTHLTEGGNGYGGSTPTNYIYPGDPSNDGEWSECSENNPFADKRMIVSSGPFTFPSGHEITITYAVIWVRPPEGTYPCPSFSMLQDTADCVMEAYHLLYPTGIEEPEAMPLTVYPNPATDRVHLPLSLASGSKMRVTVRNALGKAEIQNLISLPGSDLDVSALATGIYFVEIVTSSQKYQGKFVKE
jgi:hypothetical protein